MRRRARFDVALWAKRTATVTATVLLIVAVIWIVSRAGVALTLTVAALLVAVALDRPVQWLEEHGLRRRLGIALVMVLVLATLAGIAVVLVPPAVAQIRQLVEHGPALLERLQQSTPYQFVQRHFDVNEYLRRLQERAPTVMRELLDPAFTAVTAVIGGVAGLVTILVMVVFMLATGRPLVESVLAKARPSRQRRYATVLHKIYHSMGGYIAGLLLLVLVNAVFAGTFLAILGVPYFLPLAILSGISSLVPYVGALAAGVVLSLASWVNDGLWAGVATVVYYVAYQQFESHVIGPLVYRRTVNLNPLVILVTVLFMTELAGIPGALVAVPLAATVKIIVQEITRARLEHLQEARERRRRVVLRDAIPADDAPH